MSIDAGTKRRLFVGLITNWISKLSSSLIQFAQVSVLTHFWSLSLYGNWLIVTSIPTFLSFSNIGFGSVAGNEMTMAEARGDRETSLRVFQSCWWLIVIIMAATGVLVAIALAFVPVATLLGVHDIDPIDAKWIIAYLGASVMFGQLEQLLQASYRSIGRYSYGTFVKSMISLIAFGGMLVPVALGHGPRTAALVFACANVTGTLTLGLMVRRQISWIRFGFQYASFAEIKRLAPPAFAFMGFPMGNALNLQGTLQVVGYALGADAVAIFATARTVSRIALQMVQMINNTFEPEFSKSFGAGHVDLVRTLHRRACQAGLLVAFGVVAVIVLGGPYLLNHLTHGKVPPSRELLTILLMVVVAFSLWNTSSTILTATNQHKRLATVYVGATALTVLATYIMAKYFGLLGAAASLLLSEFLMNLYVLPATLRIAQDTFPAFVRALMQLPPALHPQALLRRFRRSKPALEG